LDPPGACAPVVAAWDGPAAPTTSPAAPRAADPNNTIAQSEQVLAELLAIPGRQIPARLLNEAQGVAIIPRVIKIGSGVLVPTATAHGEPWRIAGRVVRGLLGPGWLIVPATMILSRLLFLMYGDAYVFSWTTAALLGLCVYVHAGVSLSSDLMVAGGLESLRIASGVAILTAILNVVGNVLLIPSYGVDGSLIATAGSSAISLVLRMAYLLRSRSQM